MKNNRLFIVAGRLPVCVEEHQGKVTVKSASGGLVSAIKSYLQQQKTNFSQVFWAGVPGCTLSGWKEAASCLDESSFTYLPVLASKDQYDQYYDGFTNSVLWPLFHYFPSYVEYNKDWFENYIAVNQQFADVLAMQCCESDTIWIHDYHLLPLASMLRKYLPGITIGFFLHIPFPSFEILRLMPRKWQEIILEGMLGADLVGFHTIDYATHFLESIQKVIGLDNDRNIVRYADRLIKVDVFPISIDYNKYSEAFDSPEVIARREDLRIKINCKKIIFSVDRLDYTKGVHNRLQAYELFLRQNPEYHNEVVFIINVVPSRDTIPKYAERKQMIDILISRINSCIGNLHWQPVIYRYHAMEFDEMLALYTACDLALITPLRDGMNLVAKEFVASRKDGKGVLILSEMTGAACELTSALIINPNDIQEMALKIKEGLELTEDEQQQRLSQMQHRIRHYDVAAWAEDFMIGLGNIRKSQQSFQEIFLDEFSKRELYDSFRSANRRLLLLDYDGTLVSFSSDPSRAVPDANLISLLRRLAGKPDTDVYIISGRNSAWLEKYFGTLPVHLIAEHGARCKDRNGVWQTEVQTFNEWKGKVHHMMEMYVRRCPGSFIEEKEFSMVWHFRNAEAGQGKLRAIELASELHSHINKRHLRVTTGNKIVEVRNASIDKGTAIRKIIDRKDYDFVFAVGDDKTDEDMFKALVGREKCFTIKVGPNASYAQYNLLKPQMVVSLLEGLQHLTISVPVH